MAENVTFAGRVRREHQRFFINSTELFGVQSINLGYAVGGQNLAYLGMNNANFVPAGAQVGNVSLNRLMLDSDPLLNYTGENGFNGYILKNLTNGADNYSFTSGFVTQYGLKCAVGEIPQSNAGITVFGNMGKIATGESSQTLTDFANISAATSGVFFNLTSYGALTVSINDFNSNRLLGLDLSLKINRNPIYRLGSKAVKNVFINYPIEVDCSFEVDINDYDATTLDKYLNLPKVENLTLNLNHFTRGHTIQSFAFSNMELLGEERNVNIDGNVVSRLAYKGYIL
jgi:hypothetical protein